ncbi:MAG TPA: acyl carrier protein [Acidimicrobiales bacterium]|nr:acyl carrier protein [Acidimicrobiales bacterium]
MRRDDALDLIKTVLHQVAPEASIDDVGPNETLQEALDMDSIDFLNLVIGLSEKTGIDIPERDYPEMTTVDGLVSYLTSRV